MKKFYNFITKNNVNELYVYGEIIGGSEKWAEDDITFKDFRDCIEGIADGSNLDLYINSPGGSVFATQSILSIINRAKARGITINGYIDGLGASCASWLACACDNIYIYNHSVMMLHKPMTFSFGNSNDLAKEIELLDKLENEVMIPVYLKKASEELSEEALKNMLEAETWLTSDEIVRYFDVTLLEEERKLVACADKEILAHYKNTPESLLVLDEVPQNIGEPIETIAEENITEDDFEKLFLDVENKIKEVELMKALV